MEKNLVKRTYSKNANKIIKTCKVWQQSPTPAVNIDDTLEDNLWKDSFDRLMEQKDFVPVIKIDTRNLTPYTQESSLDESYIASSAMKKTNNFLKLASTPLTKSNKGGPVFGEVSPINNSNLSKSAINSSSELFKVDSCSLPEILEANPTIKQQAGNFLGNISSKSQILERRTYESTNSMKFSQMNSLHKFMNSPNSTNKYAVSDSNIFRESRSSHVVCQSSPLRNSNKDNIPETNVINNESNVPCKSLSSKTVNNMLNISKDTIDFELQAGDNEENDRLKLKNNKKITELENLKAHSKMPDKRIRKRNPKYDYLIGGTNSKSELNDKKLKKSKITRNTDEVLSLKTNDCTLNLCDSKVITKPLKNVPHKGKKRKKNSEDNEILPIKKRNYKYLKSNDKDNLVTLRKSKEQSSLKESSVDNVSNHEYCLGNGSIKSTTINLLTSSSSTNDLLESINSPLVNFVTLRKSNEITKSKEEYKSTRTLNSEPDMKSIELSYFVTQRKSKEKKYSTDIIESNSVNIINIPNNFRKNTTRNSSLNTMKLTNSEISEENMTNNSNLNVSSNTIMNPNESSATPKKYTSVSNRENYSHIDDAVEIRETNNVNESNSFKIDADLSRSIYIANLESPHNLNTTGNSNKEVYNNSNNHMEDNKKHNSKNDKTTNLLEEVKVHNSTISDENGTIYVIADDSVSSRVTARTRSSSIYNTKSRNAGRSRREKYDNSKTEGYINESRSIVQSEDMISSNTNLNKENISRMDDQKTKASVSNSKNSFSKNRTCGSDTRELEKFASTTNLSIAAISPGVQSKISNKEPKVKFIISPSYDRYSRQSVQSINNEKNSRKNVSLDSFTENSQCSVIEPITALSTKISETKPADKQKEQNIIITIDSTLETSTLENSEKLTRDSENICTKTTIRKSRRLKERQISTTIHDKNTPPNKKRQNFRKTNSIRLSLLPKNCLDRKSMKSYPNETSKITEENKNSSQNNSLVFNSSRKVIRPGNWRRSLAAWKSNRISRRCITLNDSSSTSSVLSCSSSKSFLLEPTDDELYNLSTLSIRDEEKSTRICEQFVTPASATYIQTQQQIINEKQLQHNLQLQKQIYKRRRTTVLNDCGEYFSDLVCYPKATTKDIVLRRCGQSEPLPFSEVFTSQTLRNSRKIGEGVYGEVFMNKTSNGQVVVLKIIPIEGPIDVNGEPQKKYDEILSEIVIAMELSNLRKGDAYMTNGFVEVLNVRCVQGRYPDYLVELWELYRDNNGTENDHPEIFNEEQLFIVLELGNGGQDLEAFTFENALQSHSAFLQTAVTLAVAEKKFQFEHRDLHWGNILLLQTDEKEIVYKLDNKILTIPTHGVRVTIIDFTLSRMTYDNCCIYNDLAHDEELFSADGDYQFSIYRLMKESLNNCWEKYNPYSNVLWLHYVVDKMINGARYRLTKNKKHRSAIHDMMILRDFLLDYKSAYDYIRNIE